ncbi:MAG: AAA family ATPase, partial [Bryobacteraceae bacterium]
MRVQTPYSLLDAAACTYRLGWDHWQTLVGAHPFGVDVFPAPPDPVPDDALNPGRLRSVLRFTRSGYAWVVADLGEYWDGRCTAFFDEFDELWLVSTADPVGLHQARRALQALPSAGIPTERIRLVMNRTTHAASSPEDTEPLLGRQPDIWLPESVELHESQWQPGQLDLRGRAARRILKVAAQLAGIPESRLRPNLALPAFRMPRRVKLPSLLPRL